MLWIIGVIAIISIKLNFSLDSFWGWASVAIFIVVFCVIAMRVQKLEIKNKR